MALVFVSPARLDYEMLSSGANVYFAPQKWGTVIDHAESIDGGLTTVTTRPLEDATVKTLLTNGKFQGNDAQRGEVQAQIGFAALPLLHQGRRENALVLGYGTGASSRVLHDAGFAHLEIADLSRDVVRMADAHFASINGKVSQQPGVQTHITDGRNLLLLTKRQYDVISIEISSIWFAGAASLYNREFYQLARAKMRPDGVLQQWVQLHHMAPTDLLTIIGTLRAEFAYVSLYVVGGQGILIATNDAAHAEPLPAVVAALDAAPRLQAVRDLAGRSFADIAARPGAVAFRGRPVPRSRGTRSASSGFPPTTTCVSNTTRRRPMPTGPTARSKINLDSDALGAGEPATSIGEAPRTMAVADTDGQSSEGAPR